jgi:hypothetical protein
VGGTRAFAQGMHATQPGDPLKAAEAIARALAAEATPLRLQVGADSVAALRSHAKRLLAELAAWAEVAVATALPA